MADFDNRNRGSIWRNEKKDSDKHPDFTGSLNVDGTDYWVSAWKRKEGASDRAPALSFSVNKKDGKAHPARPAQKPTSRDDIEDSIPF